MKRLSEHSEEDLLKELISRNKIVKTPLRTSWGDGMKSVLIGIGEDNTADIYLHQDGINSLSQTIDPAEDKLSASEALFGFCGWLTTRKEITKMGSTNECSTIVDRIDEFCKANNLSKPSGDWHHNLISPSGECSHGNDQEEHF